MISLLCIIVLLLIFYLLAPSFILPKSTFLERDPNQCFRGILALLIVFHHVCKYYVFPMSSEGGAYGITVVGLFFFFSGYGLVKQYVLKGKSYCNGFILKRAKKLLPCFFFITILCVIAENLLNINILELGGGKIGCILVPNSWYVYVLFFFYIVFAVCGRFFKKPIQIVSMLFGATFALILFTSIVNLGDWWWKSSFAFNVGTLLPLLEEKQRKNELGIAREKKILFFIFTILVVSAILNVFSLSYYKVRSIFMIVLTTILPIYLYLVFKKVTFYGNKILHFLGSLSYEIYLIHGVVLIIVKNVFLEMKTIQCVIIVYLVTIVFSLPIYKLSKWSLIKK